MAAQNHVIIAYEQEAWMCDVLWTTQDLSNMRQSGKLNRIL